MKSIDLEVVLEVYFVPLILNDSLEKGIIDGLFGTELSEMELDGSKIIITQVHTFDNERITFLLHVGDKTANEVFYSIVGLLVVIEAIHQVTIIFL